jgi:hypothetical protein
MKFTKLAVAVSTTFAFSSAALAGITIGVSLSAAAAMAEVAHESRTPPVVRIENGGYKLVAN